MSADAAAGQSLTLDPDRRPGGRAWTVFTTSVLVYVIAVAGRTSFSVAVPLAGDRFGGGSADLALFVVLQLGVYALAQVPVGLLLDRFGSRRVLACGALVVSAGQVGLALAHSLPTAIVARVLVGAGDATAFIGAIRLIPAWFALGRVPIMTQLVSILGQLGQIVPAFPFLSLPPASSRPSARGRSSPPSPSSPSSTGPAGRRPSASWAASASGRPCWAWPSSATAPPPTGEPTVVARPAGAGRASGRR